MKTIEDIARDLNVSKQTVYERVKLAGVSLESLTRKKQGKSVVYDEESVSVIMSACQVKRVKRGRVKLDRDDTKKRQEELSSQIEQLTHALEEARQEIDRLRAVEEEQRHTISSQAETIRLKEVKEAQAAMRLEAAQPEKVGIIDRIIRALYKGKPR